MSKDLQHPTVAILVAVYNGEKYLEPLLSSLLAQDYPNISIYVRDNCSTDQTVSILNQWKVKYPSKFTIILSEKNLGIIGNFASLAEIASEPYIMFCDADDIWLPNKVSSTLNKMRELESKCSPETPLLVHTDLEVVDKELKTIAPSFWKYSHLNSAPQCEQLPRLIVQNHVTGCTMMLNKPLLDLALPIPLDCIMHDWWIALVAATFGHIGNLPQATILYRQHGNNDTGAHEYSFLNLLKKFMKNKVKLNPKRIYQVNQLLLRFGNTLPKDKQKTLQDYLKMQQSILPKKIILKYRGGFYSAGFLRNAKFFN